MRSQLMHVSMKMAFNACMLMCVSLGILLPLSGCSYQQNVSSAKRASYFPMQHVSVSSTSETIAVPHVSTQPDATIIATEVIPLLRHAHVYPFESKQLTSQNVWQLLKQVDPHANMLSKISYQSLLHFAADSQIGLGFELHYDARPRNQGVRRQQVKHAPMYSPWVVRFGASSSLHSHQNASFPEGMPIVAINQHVIADYPEADVLKVNRLLLGAHGTSVKLTVVNPYGKLQDITLQRKQAVHAYVSLAVVNDVGVLGIPSFVVSTPEQVIKQLAALPELAKLKGVVIDLRHNPGGVMDAALELGALFSVNMPLVHIKTRQEQHVLTTANKLPKGFHQSDRLAKFRHKIQHVPLMILVDRQTASAAEAFASGFQAANRAVVYGQTTYGKGSIQQVAPLSDGSALIFTVAHYTKVDGKPIDNVGVTPDVVVPMHILHNNQAISELIQQVFSVESGSGVE